MNKFRLGIITGMSSLVIAVPVIAQVTSAQSSASADVAGEAIPSQACVAAMADLEEAHLAQFDEMNAQRKQGIQTRITALNSAASITDDTARQEALDQMREDMKTQVESMKDSAVSDELQAAMDAVKAACGDTFKLRFDAFKGEHPMIGKFTEKAPAFIAEKLGMTKEELKAALDSGKTIPEIAEEKGVDLPMPGRGHRVMRFFGESIDQ
jgi:hypothetical protein